MATHADMVGELWEVRQGRPVGADVDNRDLIGASHRLGIDERRDSDRGLRCPKMRAIWQ